MPKYFFSQFPTTYLTLCFSKSISIEHEALILLRKFAKIYFYLSLFFLVEPQILNMQCPSSKVEGSKLTLSCNATGNPPPNITWIWKDTGDVLGSNEELTFSAVNRSQTGNYQCLARNGIANSSTRTCSLEVFCK